MGAREGGREGGGGGWGGDEGGEGEVEVGGVWVDEEEAV